MAESLARAKKGEQRPPKTTEDKFVEGVLRGWRWMRQNARTAVLTLACVAVIVAGVLYFRSYRQTVRERAAIELRDIRVNVGQDPVGSATRLESFVNRYDGTPSAEEGRLLLARLQIQYGQFAEAISTLGAIGASADAPNGFAAHLLQASALRQQGDLDAALRTLEQVGRGARYGFQRRYARSVEGQYLLNAGRLEEAAAVWSALVAETEEPGERAAYQLRLGEARGLLRAASAAVAAPGEEPAEPAEQSPDAQSPEG
jgi:predicted negative regulator of RcsB-dependent stress response